MMSIIPLGPLAAGTSIALLDTMTIRDTVLGVAGVLEIRAPLVGVITHQVLVAEVLTQGGVRMETMGPGVAMTTIRQADLHRAMIATLRVVIVTAIPAAEVAGGTAPVPLPRHLAVTHLRRDPVGMPLVHHKVVHTAVLQGSILSLQPEEVTEVLIITAVVLAPLDKGLPLMTVMDHRLVVVVVVLVLVVVPTAADHRIAEEIPGPMVPRQIPAEVQPVMTSREATVEEALRTGELKLP